MLKNHFRKTILLEMNVLDRREAWEKLIALIPDESARKTIADELIRYTKRKADERWLALRKCLPEKVPLLK
jgi:hypothetical protein